jgi:hypothetical protein
LLLCIALKQLRLRNLLLVGLKSKHRVSEPRRILAVLLMLRVKLLTVVLRYSAISRDLLHVHRSDLEVWSLKDILEGLELLNWRTGSFEIRCHHRLYHRAFLFLYDIQALPCLLELYYSTFALDLN